MPILSPLAGLTHSQREDHLITHESIPFRVAMIYLAFSVIGIFGGDAVPWVGIPDSFRFWVSAIMGTLFIMITTAMIYWLCRREFRNFSRAKMLLNGVTESNPDALYVKDRKRMEEDLRASGHQFQELADAIPQIVWIAAPDGNITHLNAKAFEYTGIAFDHLKDWSWQKVVHPDDLPEAVLQWNEILQTGISRAVEFRIRRADGQFRWHINRQVAVRDSAGTIVAWYGTNTDIEDLKRVEAAARTNESTLQLLIDHAPMQMAMFDREMRYMHASRRWCDNFGITDPDITGKSHYEIFPKLPEEWKKVHRRAMAGSIERSEDDSMILEDGSVQFLRWEVRPWFNADNEIGGIVIFSENITDWKKSQLEQQKLVKIIEHSSDFIATADVTGKITFMNRGGRRMIGLGDDDDVTKLNYKDYVPETWQDFFLNTVLKTAKDEGQWEGDMQLKDLSTGKLFDVHRTKFFVQGTNPHDDWYATVTRDITEQNRNQAELRATRDRMAKTMESVPIAICSFALTKEGRSYMPFASHQLKSIYGLEPEQVANDSTPIFDRIHPDDRSQVVAAIHESAATLTPWRRQYRVQNPDRGLLWIEGHSIPSSQPDGTIIWHGYVADITERKRDEEALHESMRLLRISEQRFRQLADAIPQMVWVIDPRGTATHVNAKSIEYTGLSEQQLLGSDWSKSIHPDDLPAVVERMNASQANGTLFDIESRIRRNDGVYCWHVIRAFPVRDLSGSILEWYGTSTDVEDLKQTEHALRERERFLRIITSAAQVGMIVMNDRYEILFANETYATMTNADPTTIVGRKVPEVNPATWDQIKPNLDRVLAGQRVEFEVTMSDPSGTSGLRWNRAISQPLIDDHGRLSAVTVIMEITELKLSRQLIAESEERYRRLIEFLPEAFFAHDTKQTLFCNPAFVRLMGAKTMKEILGKDPFQFFHPDDHEVIWSRIKAALPDSPVKPGIEIKAVRLDGRLIPVHIVGAAISGYGPNAYIVAFSDLTERERSVSLLRSVMESVNDAILTFDAKGKVLSANFAVDRLFGFAIAEIVGNNVATLMPEPFHSEHDNDLSNFFNTGIAKVIGIGREVEGLRKDGTRFPIELTITEFEIDGGRHFTGVMRDITARKRLETQFHQAQKMESVGRLAGGVAHDFNNLLTVINGYAHMMLVEIPLDDPKYESILAILDAGDRAANLTQQLLAFSRKTVVEPQMIDLNEIIEKSVNMLRRLIEEDIQLTVIPCPILAKVKVAPGQLEQVLMNLAVNARDAMPDGGRLVIETRLMTLSEGFRAEFSDASLGDYVQLSFSDNGHGMNDEVKKMIFEPFFTTKPVGKGTGLGLAVVHGIVQQCGGSIAVESTVGVGTTFKLLFPISADPSAAASAKTALPPTRGNETILLVEDQPAVRKIARTALETNGYKVLEASGGHDAIRLCETYPGSIDLLLTDVVMPEIGGIKLAEALRKHRLNLRVLYMSGYTDDAVFHRGVKDAQEKLLQKPFTALGLARKVRSVLDEPLWSHAQENTT